MQIKIRNYISAVVIITICAIALYIVNAPRLNLSDIMPTRASRTVNTIQGNDISAVLLEELERSNATPVVNKNERYHDPRFDRHTLPPGVTIYSDSLKPNN